MNNDIDARLQDILRTHFANSTLSVTRETTPRDVRGWDSMANVTLAVEIERSFGIRIRPAEMEAVRNVGDLITLISRHLSPSLS